MLLAKRLIKSLIISFNMSFIFIYDISLEIYSKLTKLRLIYFLLKITAFKKLIN
jgi:hypothetical protein